MQVPAFKRAEKSTKFRFGVQAKIVLVMAAVVVAYSALIFGYILPETQKALYAEKKVETQQQVESAWTVLQYYQNLEKTGVLTRDQAQEQAKAAITTMRYGADMKDYFYILDFTPVMLVNPNSPQLVNTDISGLKDSTGKLFIQEQLQIAKTQNEGFSSYMWKYNDDASRVEPKLTYVKAFEPWQWIIATGIYTVDVEQTVGAVRMNLIVISLVLLLASIGFLYWMTRVTVDRPMKALANLVPIARAVAAGDVDQDIQGQVEG